MKAKRYLLEVIVLLQVEWNPQLFMLQDATTMYSTRSSRLGQSSGSGSHQYQRKHCDFCNMKGHTRADCYKLQKCEHCLQKGHVKENCYKLIGYPENFKGKKRANVATHPLAGLNLGYNHGPQATEHGVGVGPAPPLTQHQYNQIVQMLNKCSIGDTGANMGGN
uniref:Putative ovule protein n=1 Tax=Solanum chacoense TaxID=4108 RepID=A0A0V0IHS6_SOLCH